MRIKQTAITALLLLPMTCHASFIETTIGTAVVNDATATFHNPAGLVALKKTQIVGLGSLATFQSTFKGSVTQNGFTQTGTADSQSHYQIPSLYIGVPLLNKFTLGLAIITDEANRSVDDNSILRYSQASNTLQDKDIIPAIGLKINPYFAVGAGVNFSYSNFVLQPVTGIPTLNIPDSRSHNQYDGHGIGGNIGVLWRPNDMTVAGFDYHSSMTYNLSGTSTFNGTPPLTSNQYSSTLWTPARSVLSVNHFINHQLGFVGTAQYIQWNIYRNVHINGIATPFGIVNATSPYHLHNSWLFTLGSHYRVTPQWIVRVAASYVESPGNRYYQISNGNSYVVGASTGYTMNDTLTLEAGYAHVFVEDVNIHINNNRTQINGTNSAYRNAVSLKLMVNI